MDNQIKCYYNNNSTHVLIKNDQYFLLTLHYVDLFNSKLLFEAHKDESFCNLIKNDKSFSEVNINNLKGTLKDAVKFLSLMNDKI